MLDGDWSSDVCSSDLKAAGVNSKVSGATVTFTYNETTGAWSCASSLAAEIKRKSC
jgi:hypothetical protein